MRSKKQRPRPGRQNLGRTIRKLRIDLDVTQKKLAKRAKISQSYLCLIEKGWKFPDFRRLERIAKSLEQTPGRLMMMAELPSLDKAFALLEQLSYVSMLADRTSLGQTASRKRRSRSPAGTAR